MSPGNQTPRYAWGALRAMESLRRVTEEHAHCDLYFFADEEGTLVLECVSHGKNLWLAPAPRHRRTYTD